MAAQGDNEDDGIGHTRDTVGAHACRRSGDQIPDSLFADNTKGIDGAWRGLSVGTCVEEGELAVAGDGVCTMGSWERSSGEGRQPVGSMWRRARLRLPGLHAVGHGCHELCRRRDRAAAERRGSPRALG